jgi:small subunit ribosomal protein S6
MSNITHYELTTIIDSNIPDNEHQEIIDKMKKLISENKGEISSEENLGRKKLSYPIEKSLKGVFICLEFNIEPKTIKTIEKELKLDKNIIRHLIIKKPENVTPINIENPKKEEKIAKEVKVEKTEDSSEIVSPKGDLQKEEKIAKEVKVEKTEILEKTTKKNDREDKRADLNDLDKKLDEILNDEIIN